MIYKTLLKKSTDGARPFRLRFFAGAILGLLAGIGMLAATTAGAYAASLSLATLHTFVKTDGANPYGALVADADGNLYGTTYNGGAHDKGTVFKITPTGTLTVLHSFDGSDGANPSAGLVLGADGNLYGTTSQGGASSQSGGTVFKITPTGTLTTLHSFCSTISYGICADGQNPDGGLIVGKDGNFYGTTPYGGGDDPAGVLFKLTPAGDYMVVHDFDSVNLGGPVVEVSDGSFYGVSKGGGLDLLGSVFKIAADGSYTQLYSFTGNDDGDTPEAALLLASDGNFYGTTLASGAGGHGTVFKITPAGTLTTLHAFDGSDGDAIKSALIEGKDGNFYGTTENGGEHGDGVIFRMTPGGTLTVVHSFAVTDGNNPLGALLETQAGTFYGTTFAGGVGGLTPDVAYGTVYRLSGAAGTPPPAPTSLTAIAGNASVTLTWNASSGAASYNVYEGTSAGGEAATPAQTAITGISATVTDLANGKTYYFTVAAVNDSGTSAYSNEASATPLPVPGQVTGLRATPGNGSAKLAWTAVSGATGYTIEQGTSTGKEKPVATGVTATTYTASGLSNGTKYYFEVVATNSAGSGPVSAEVSTTPAAGVTATPTFDPPGGNYSMAQHVTLSDTTAGAAIYYTTDGSTPTTDSTRYDTPIKVSASETIKAIATASGSQNSAIATATYTIKQGKTGGGGGGGATSPVLLLLLALAFLGRRRWLERNDPDY